MILAQASIRSRRAALAQPPDAGYYRALRRKPPMRMPQSLHGTLDVWGGGQLMAFSAMDGRTDFVDGLVARTAGPHAGLDVMLPGKVGITFDDAPPSSCFVSSDVLTAETSRGNVCAVFLDAHHILIEGPCHVRSHDPLVSVTQFRNRTLVASRRYEHPPCIAADAQDAVAKRLAWLAARPIPPTLSPRQRRTTVKALSIMKGQVCSPEGAIAHRWTTPDRWPHGKMWLWDSAFHAIGWRHIDVSVARDAIEAVLDCQFPDGRIAISAAPFEPDKSGKTQPPVLALAAWLVDQASPDSSWIEHVYPPLCRYVEWDLANRDSSASGLLEWATGTRNNCRCDESGADNSPRFDTGEPLHAPDFNALIALECELLARMAARIGRPDDEQALWTDRHARICRRMNERLWSKAHSLYMDVPVGQRDSTGVMSFAGLLPLVCLAPDRRRAVLMARHLVNPATFGSPLPVPTIAPRGSPRYRKDMWCGPVWVNINWLIALGLTRSGVDTCAEGLRGATMDEIESRYETLGSLFEFYDDEKIVPPPSLDRKGPCTPGQWLHQVVHDYGWTASCYADWIYSTAGL
jgi:hypothetical protein